MHLTFDSTPTVPKRRLLPPSVTLCGSGVRWPRDPTALPACNSGGFHGRSQCAPPNGWVVGRLEVVCGVIFRSNGCGGPLQRHDLEGTALGCPSWRPRL